MTNSISVSVVGGRRWQKQPRTIFLGSLWISIRNFDFTQNVIRNQTLIFSIIKTMIKQTHIYTQLCVINYKKKTLIAPEWKNRLPIKENIHWKDWCWIWSSNTLATWCEELTHWKWLWCWERSKAGGEGDNRGWDGWRASLTQWTRVWANSGR